MVYYTVLYVVVLCTVILYKNTVQVLCVFATGCRNRRGLMLLNHEDIPLVSYKTLPNTSLPMWK